MSDYNDQHTADYLASRQVTTATLIPDRQPRDCIGAACTCNGFADRLPEPTAEEDAQYGCQRRYLLGCCCAAFVCRLCGRRLVARLEAPESVD